MIFRRRVRPKNIFPSHQATDYDRRRMNEMTQTPPLSDVRSWWIAWTVAVVGGPLLVMFASAFNGVGEGSGVIGLMVGFASIIGGIAHFVASIGLARRISYRRDPDAKTGAIAGLTLAFLFGGWTVMIAVFFVGCLAAVAMG